MKAQQVGIRIGKRYDDDSGWECMAEYDCHGDTLSLELGGGDVYRIDGAYVDWLASAADQIKNMRDFNSPDAGREGE